MHAEMTHGIKTDSPAMRWGRLAHAAILEPDRFFNQARIWEGRRQGGKYDEFVASSPDPEMIVTQDELDKLAAMSAMVHANKAAHHIIQSTGHEVTLKWDSPAYGSGKLRADMLSDDMTLLADYKTTRSIVPRDFWRAAFGMAYHVRMGWYAHGVYVLTGKLPAVRMIVQESSAPYDCWVANMPGHIVLEGAEQAVEIAKRYSICRQFGTFPGVVYDGTMIDYELPAWATEQKEERLDDGEGEASEL
jgi:hypothetical protein